MMHTGPMNESDGSFKTPSDTKDKCPRCGQVIQHQTWESNDGAFEDSKYSCMNPKCGYTRWVDGIDS